MNKINIVTKKITELKPYENNARINDDAIDVVANSIKKFKFRNPILIDKNNTIIAGHTRLLACEKLGIEEVPCIIVDDLTDDEIKAYRIADNSTAQISEWDLEKLQKELDSIEMDMEMLGLDEQLKEMYDSIIDDFENESESELKANDKQTHTCPACGCEFED